MTRAGESGQSLLGVGWSSPSFWSRPGSRIMPSCGAIRIQTDQSTERGRKLMKGSPYAPILFLAVAALTSGGVPAPCEAQATKDARAIGKVVDIRAFFEGGTDVQVTFVLKTRSDGTLLRHDPRRSSMRFRPASTFKIPNTVIGLETGVVAGPDHVFPFHPDLVPEVGFFARSWRSDHTLESAFRNSVYWYYQEVARRVGRVRMQAWLDAFGYGNREMGDEVDSFWLHGDLRISAIEQVRFLSDLLEGRFDVSRPTLESLTDISILEEGDGWKLHGKTGTSNVTPTRENGWLVGWVDAAEERWYYALNMEGERVWEDWPPGARADLVLRILAHVGVPVEASRTGPDPTEQVGVG